MVTIKLMFDYDEGPIWPNYIDPYTFERSTGIDMIDNDQVIKDICSKMSNMYSDYYTFDTDDSPCKFDFEKQKKDKDNMLRLLTQLKNRLNEINDGSFVIDDQITKEYDNL